MVKINRTKAKKARDLKLKAKANIPARMRVAGSSMKALETRVRNHVEMIADPCNALLGPTAYRGSDGSLTRVRRLDSFELVGGGADVAYFFVYYPAYNAIWKGGINDLTQALTPDWTSAPGPGQPFFLATADSSRPVGACVDFNYTGTELNRSGQLFRGCIPVSTLTGASINQLIAMVQGNGIRMPDTEVGTLWSPAPADESYWEVGGAAPEESGDRNCIVNIIIRGATSSASISGQFATTFINEWRPKFGLGLSVPNPSSPDTPGGLERVKLILSRLGHWYLTGPNAESNRSKLYGTLAGVRAGISMLAAV